MITLYYWKYFNLKFHPQILLLLTMYKLSSAVWVFLTSALLRIISFSSHTSFVKGLVTVTHPSVISVVQQSTGSVF